MPDTSVTLTKVRQIELLSHEDEVRLDLVCAHYGIMLGTFLAALQTRDLRALVFKSFTLRNALVDAMSSTRRYNRVCEQCHHPEEYPLKRRCLPSDELPRCRAAGKLLRIVHDRINSPNLHLQGRHWKLALEEAIQMMHTYWLSVKAATKLEFKSYTAWLNTSPRKEAQRSSKDPRARARKTQPKRAKLTPAENHYANWILAMPTAFFCVLEGGIPDPSVEGQIAMGVKKRMARKKGFDLPLEKRKPIANKLRRIMRKVMATSVRPPRCSPPTYRADFDCDCWKTVMGEDGCQYLELMNLAGTTPAQRKAWDAAQATLPKDKRQPCPEGDRIRVRLKGICHIRGTLQLIHEKDGTWTTRTCEERMCEPERTKGMRLGIDLGRTEVLTTMDGTQYGIGFGKLASALIDESNQINARRQVYQNKVKELIASGKPEDLEKAQRIIKFNLGDKKVERKRRRFDATLKGFINQAINLMLNHYDRVLMAVAMEHITNMTARKFGKKMNDYLTKWQRGYIRERMELKCKLKGVLLIPVNPAQTSVTCPICGYVDKRNRHGDDFECLCCGWKAHADQVGAFNTAVRVDKPEITLKMPPDQVLEILTDECERHAMECDFVVFHHTVHGRTKVKLARQYLPAQKRK